LSVSNDRHLIISQDGPKKNGDIEKIELCMQVLSQLEWKAEVEIFQYQKNQGIEQSVRNAVDYAMEKFGKAIVLEDDNIPSESFIPFMERALENFAKDHSIGHISGYSAVPKDITSRYVNELSKSIYPFSWGWASWDRAWNKYDSDLKYWQSDEADISFDDLGFNQIERFIWKKNFSLAERKILDSWAIRWTSTLWKNRMFSINSRFNLIEYAGNYNGSHSMLPKFYNEQSLSNHKFTFLHNPVIDHQSEKWISKRLHRCNYGGAIIRLFSDYVKVKIS
jgi:hypothetical protein